VTPLKLLAAALLAHTADVVTTTIGLSLGLVEANPVAATQIGHGWLTWIMLGYLSIVLAWWVFGLDPRAGRPARVGMAALLAAPALLNAVTILGLG
jgi:hypothetical protein